MGVHMPTYDYTCSKCGHTFERICRIANRLDAEQEPCPGCNDKCCVSLTINTPSLVSPFRVDGLVKPKGDFKERMQQIKSKSGRKNTIKDY
jgi:putative FmdB family regulatory protein